MTTATATKTLRIFVTGSSGLVGSHVVPYLEQHGHDVVRMVRSPQKAAEGKSIVWKPNAARVNASDLEGADAIIHLAGENIAGRWTQRKKQAIHDSRVTGTRTLAEAVAKLDRRPGVLICASAAGYFGDRGDEVLTEDSETGTGFLAKVCREWEAACEPARQAGVRIVNLRFGLVLSTRGGALKTMLTPFKLGIAGVIGSGRQYWPWIAIDDCVGVIDRALVDESLAGPINTVAPQQVTNREFTKTLGRVLRRPTALPMPAFAAQLIFGREMANETMLASERIEPKRLREAGHEYRFRQLEPALRHVLGR
jgi:uncharacterized protein